MARFLKEGQGGIGGGDHLHDVDIETLAEVVGRARGRQRTGIGDENIETAERGRSLRDPGRQRLGIGDIDAAGKDRGALGFERAGCLLDLRSAAGAESPFAVCV